MSNLKTSDIDFRFQFGENWQNFLSTLTEAQIKEAKLSLKNMFEIDSLAGKNFLDAPTAVLMISFYRNLKKKMNVTVALRNAMLETKEVASDPKYWAAFTLYGALGQDNQFT